MHDGGCDKSLACFTHEAMDTIFEVRVWGQELDYARQGAYEAFRLVDRLEGLLSRFIEGSEVWQINHLAAGQWVRVGEDTLQCLQMADRMYKETAGAFDITIGPVSACWRGAPGRKHQPDEEELNRAILKTGMELLEINETEYAVGVKTDGVRIDLGGIGKGYAVDRLAQLLTEWEIENAMILGGASTVYGMGHGHEHKGWPVRLSAPNQEGRLLASLYLRQEALSASGTLARGEHVIDPRRGEPVRKVLRAWARAPSAAQADALSTAFCVMTEEEVKEYCRRHEEIGAMILVKGENQTEPIRLGHWG